MCNRKTLFACIAKKLERFLILRCRLSFFLVNMYVVLIQLKVKAIRRKQRQLVETYWSHIKFLHINDQTCWRYIYFDFYFALVLSPEESWRTRKWKRLSNWKIILKVPQELLKGVGPFWFFPCYLCFLIIFTFWAEDRNFLGIARRSSKGKIVKWQFCAKWYNYATILHNSRCFGISFAHVNLETIIIFNISPNFWSVSILL